MSKRPLPFDYHHSPILPMYPTRGPSRREADYAPGDPRAAAYGPSYPPARMANPFESWPGARFDAHGHRECFDAPSPVALAPPSAPPLAAAWRRVVRMARWIVARVRLAGVDSVC